jgi:hypothetical protein
MWQAVLLQHFLPGFSLSRLDQAFLAYRRAF